VIQTNQDSPLEIFQPVIAPLVTIAGTLTTTLYSPGQEKHGIVLWCIIDQTSGPTPATEAFSATINTVTSGVVVPVYTQFAGVAMSVVPLIGSKTVLAGAGAVQLHGVNPVYVPPGGSLIYNQASVAGGITITPKLLVWERLKSYPLPLTA